MDNSKTVIAARNVFFGAFNKIFALLVPFIIRTIILKKLGEEYLGISSLFSSIIQILNLSELGIGAAVVFNLYKPIAENDEPKINAYLNLLKKTYRIIGTIILFTGIMAMPFIPNLISGGYPSNINIYILFAIYLLNTVLSYYLFSYENSLLVAFRRDDIESKINLIINFLMYSVQIILLIALKDYYLYAICMPIFTILLNLVRHNIVKHKFNRYECKGKLGQEDVKIVKKKIFALMGHKIGLPLTNSIDTIVVSSFLGLATLACFTNYSYVFSAIGGILTICYSSLTSSIGNSIITQTKEKNYDNFKLLTFINLWVVTVISVCLICVLQNFIEVWFGENMLMPFYVVIGIGAEFFFAYMRFIVNTYKDAAGMWTEDILKPYIIAIGNLVLNVVFIKVFNMNVGGVLLATILLRLFVALPWETHVLFKKYFNINPKRYYLTLILWSIIGAFISLITYNITSDIGGNNVVNLFIRCIISFTIPNFILLIINLKNKMISVLINAFTHKSCVRWTG